MDDSVTYEMPTTYAAAITKALMDIWVKLGRPEEVDSASGWVMFDEIMKVWYSIFPQEVSDWAHDLAMDLELERSIHASVKAGGYMPIGVPPRLHGLIRGVFPNFKFQDRDIWHKLVARYPLFKTTNAKLWKLACAWLPRGMRN